MIKIMRQFITIDKKVMRQSITWGDIFKVLLKQWILGKFLCDRVYFGAFFMRQGTGCGKICCTQTPSFPSQVRPLPGCIHSKN